MFSVSAQREGLPLESQTGISHLPRAGAELADQTAQTHRTGRAIIDMNRDSF